MQMLRDQTTRAAARPTVPLTGHQRRLHFKCPDAVAGHQQPVASIPSVVPALTTDPTLSATLTPVVATGVAPSTSSHSSSPDSSPRVAVGGEQLSVIDPDAGNPNYNRSGLNGLTTGTTSGLQTVGAPRSSHNAVCTACLQCGAFHVYCMYCMRICGLVLSKCGRCNS